MNQIKQILFIVFIVFISLPLSAETGIFSVDGLFKAAVKNREIVKSYEIAVEQAKLAISSKKGNYLPSLDAAYKVNKLAESSKFENEKNSEISIFLTQNLFYGFKDKNEFDIAEIDLNSVECDLDILIQDISLQVALSFVAVYQAEAKRAVAEDAYKAYSERYENTSLKYSVGVATKRDLLVMKVEKDDASRNLIQAENEVEKALNQLRLITGENLKLENLDFSFFKSLPEFKSFEEYKTIMLSKRGDLKKIKAGLKKAIASENLAKASFYPKVDFVLSKRYNSNNYNAFDSGSRKDETRAQLKLAVNLFDGMKKYKNVDKAKLEQNKLEHRFNELADKLSTELENCILDAKTSEKNFDVSKEGIIEAKENLRITQLSFDNGSAAASDVLDSIYYLSRARNNEINAKAMIFVTWFKLRRLIVDFSVN
ncbi:MAG: hypothetical protein CSB21_01830 [Deltaproteobacteria bacterium]|nr:MAG: hypothetical protein CSB21_01830 [Deltaproteobacteria bacterium]